MTFTVGDVATLRYELRVDGVLTDADVVLTVTPPEGDPRLPAVTRVSLGVFEADVLVDVAGVWLRRWQATGEATDADVGRFVVRADTAPRWAPTADEIRAELPGRDLALGKVTDTSIDDLVRQRASSLAAELPAELSTRLQPVAHDYLLYAVASILEDRLFPEQSSVEGSNAQRLDQRAGAELARLRTQLSETAGGAAGAWAGSISMAGPR